MIIKILKPCQLFFWFLSWNNPVR